jgi:hypothetical protein
MPLPETGETDPVPDPGDLEVLKHWQRSVSAQAAFLT